MTLFQALILGIVQGLTEFLPVSSSAHLVLVPHLLGWNLTEAFVFPFDVLVQLGTLVAVVIYFRKDLFEIAASIIRGIRNRKPFEEAAARAGWFAILATIPAGILGLLIKDKVEAAFNSPNATSIFLFITAALLIAAEFLGKRTKDLESLSWVDAFWIGVFQAFAIFPGISRSGSTIAGAMTRNFKRKPAGQFSFILSIPVFLAAGLLGLKDLAALPKLANYIPSMLVGFLAAGVVGFFAIRWLLGFIASHSLLPFAGYCVMLGAGALAFNLFNPGVPAVASQTSEIPGKVKMNSDLIYQVSIEPDLEWMLPVMVDCQKSQEDLAILFSQAAYESGVPAENTIALAYGEISGLGSEIFQIGSDTLVIGVNPGNPLQSLTSGLANAIFSGQISVWDEVVEKCPDCFSLTGMSGNIDLYVFNPGSVFYESARSTFTSVKTISSSARLAPGAKEIRQALGQDSQAIAALPERWVDSTIITIGVDGLESPTIPILAYASSTLDENLKQWLTCVQNGIK